MYWRTDNNYSYAINLDKKNQHCQIKMLDRFKWRSLRFSPTSMDTSGQLYAWNCSLGITFTIFIGFSHRTLYSKQSYVFLGFDWTVFGGKMTSHDWQQIKISTNDVKNRIIFKEHDAIKSIVKFFCGASFLTLGHKSQYVVYMWGPVLSCGAGLSSPIL